MEFTEPNRAFRKELRREGYSLNLSEFEAVSVLKSCRVEFSRRGYPDYTILNKGEIVGFVEVKPHAGKSLRKGQEKFKNMCDRYSIPFLRWSPDDGHDPLINFIESLTK